LTLYKFVKRDKQKHTFLWSEDYF